MDNRVKTVLIIVGVALLLYVIFRVRGFNVETKSDKKSSELNIKVDKNR